VSLVREAHDWEVDVFASFFQVLHSAIVSRSRADRLWWFSSKRDLFKWLALKIVASLVRVCGGLRLIRGWLFFLCGRQP
jgi:hypothetical protein